MSVQRLFEETYGTPPSVLARAPGRVNLIGEHTDYNGGFAMPIALTQSTAVGMRVNSFGELRAASEQVEAGAIKVFRRADALGSFVSYVQGAYWVLEEAGHLVSPVDVAVSSEVPIGSGLSSSAALVVATLRAFRQLFELELSDLDIAKLAHRAEREFVGVPVGTMDQMACSLGRTDSALLLDTRSLGYEHVRLPADTELVIVDSSIRHEHVSGGFRTRREECEQAAAKLGVDLLCDLDESVEQLTARSDWQQLSAELRRRVSHVLSENQRVLAAAVAMRNNDAVRLGGFLDASHVSLRDLFEVSTPEVDALVEALRSQDGCFGARMTGGGFGGAVVALVRSGTGERVASDGAKRYSKHVSGAVPKVISPPPGEPAT